MILAPAVMAEKRPIPVLTWRDDPARSMSVTWRTSKPIRGVVKFRIKGAAVQTTPFTSTRVQLPSGAVWFYHTARMRGLTPGSVVDYVIPDGNQLTFRTAKASGPLKFLYFGDVQSDIGRTWPPMVEKALSICKDPAFMVFAGDLVDNAHDDKQWVEFFSPGERVFGQIPSIATPGNHEYKSLKARETAALSFHWKPEWDYPLNGFAELGEQSYITDIQGVRLVSMNSNRFVKQQAPWFESMMKTNPNAWTLVTYHHPVFSMATDRDNPLVRTHWDPVFRKNNVALAMQGHDHSYGRQVVKRADGKGETVYVVAVAGTKMYKTSEANRKRSRVAFEKTRTFQVVEVNGKQLSYTSYDLNGKVVDRFRIEKRADGTNRVVEG